GSRVVGAAQGPSRKGCSCRETSRITGKALYQARFRDHIAEREASVVRRGSTVRVRQRASSFLLLSWCFRCLGWRRSRASASTQRPPASTVAVVRHSARRAGGSRDRVRRG